MKSARAQGAPLTGSAPPLNLRCSYVQGHGAFGEYVPPFLSSFPTPADPPSSGRSRRVKQATWTPPPDSPFHDSTHKTATRIEVAVKVVKKKNLKGDLAAVFDEVQVLTGLDHPNVGELRSVLVSKR